MRCTAFWACFFLSVMTLLPGCESKGGQVDPGNRNLIAQDPQASEQWPQWFPHAVDVRVHPASRYVKERDALRLEARIELVDQLNEPIKDVGQLMVELRLLDDNGRILRDELGRQRGFRWEFDLTTQGNQAKYWDPIARAYILPLKIDPIDADLPERRTVLRVTFDPAWPDLPRLPTGDRDQKAVEIRTDW